MGGFLMFAAGAAGNVRSGAVAGTGKPDKWPADGGRRLSPVVTAFLLRCNINHYVVVG
jgi:hypothetical protein